MVSNKFDQPYQKNIPDLFTELGSTSNFKNSNNMIYGPEISKTKLGDQKLKKNTVSMLRLRLFFFVVSMLKHIPRLICLESRDCIMWRLRPRKKIAILILYGLKISRR